MSELPEDAIEAATEGAARFHYEAFRAVQAAVGAPNPVPYEELSERTRRIQKDQVRDAATAALAAALPFLERATRSGTVVPDSALLALETAWSDIPDLTEAARGTERAQVIALDSVLDAFFASLAAARVARGGEATE